MDRIGQIVGILMVAVALFFLVARSHEGPHVRIVFLDIGQGDGIYIQTPGGRQMIIDGGADDQVVRELGSVMPWFDRHIDWMVASHPDRDHIGGLRHVLDHYSVTHALDTGFSISDKEDYAYVRGVESSGTNRVIAERGQRIVLDAHHDVFVDVLYPNHDLSSVDDINDHSIIMVLRYGGVSLLLSGDASVLPEAYLVDHDLDNIDVDILKLGHHGSDTSSSEAFLSATSPKLAIIQSGANNHFGHPHGSVIARLDSMGIPWECTCMRGRIELRATPDGFWIHK